MLADPDVVETAFQPIVDLQRGVVVGYEALARFPGPDAASPPEWFGAARDLGIGDRLEAAVLTGQLRAVGRLPPNTFLSVNVSPDTIGAEAVQHALASAPSLESTVLEVTEQAPVLDYDDLAAALAPARERGATVAVDDAGAGYASLSHVMQLRPEFVKLDRWLITDCDLDPAKLAALEMLGALASRIDAWVIAEGIERPGELEALLDLGIPLAQGYHLSRPGPAMGALRPELFASLIEMQRCREAGVGVAGLIETVPTARADQPNTHGEALLAEPRVMTVVLVDELDRPVGLVRRDGYGGRNRRPVLVVGVDEPPADLLRRALVREAWLRFDPLVCRDGRGRYIGIVAIERLISGLLPPT